MKRKEKRKCCGLLTQLLTNVAQVATNGYDNCLFIELAPSGSYPGFKGTRGGSGGGWPPPAYILLSTIMPPPHDNDFLQVLPFLLPKLEHRSLPSLVAGAADASPAKFSCSLRLCVNIGLDMCCFDCLLLVRH